MCGRMVLTRSAAEIAEAFEAEWREDIDLAPSFNVAPSRSIPAVHAERGGRRVVSLRHWGLIPSWAKDRKLAFRMINARAETVAEKPAFRAALRSRRCLVPADGFYEWQAAGGGDRRRSGAVKRPFYFSSPDGSLLAIAGLYESWTDRVTGEVVDSCTLLTTDANEAVRPVHDRMPVLLDPGDWARWLDPRIREAEQVLPLLVPPAADRLAARAVSTHVNDTRHDDPECIAAL